MKSKIEPINCINCLDTHEIFNGKEMIPCPTCTDPAFKSQDHQSKITERFFNINEDDADQIISEEAEEA
jgi:hypothetical protein